MWHKYIKHLEQLQAVQEHAVTYLFLNCRIAWNSLHSVVVPKLKSFWLPHLFLSSILIRGRLGD